MHSTVRHLATHSTYAVGVLLLALGAVGCRPAQSDAPDATQASAKGAPGIVLLCIDTLRADAVVTTPGASETMPALDAFARGATVFSDASSSSSWTAPSVATLLTGLECSETGVYGPIVAGAIPGSVTTLAEALRDRGFACAAMTSGGWLVPERGYGQGCDSFSREFDGLGPEDELARWQERRTKTQPFFLFLHTLTAHDPYGAKDPQWLNDPLLDVAAKGREIAKETRAAGWTLPPGAGAWFLDRYLFDGHSRLSLGLSADTATLSRIFDLSMEWFDGEGLKSEEANALRRKAPDAYRAGLALPDSVFARTLAALDALSLPEGTVVAVVGDHGEALGEHGLLSHGRFLYDEMVRVPLVIRAPGRLPAGKVVAGSCGLVDVTPTLLDLAGAKPLAGAGRSLVPLANGAAKGHPVFAQEDRIVFEGGRRRTLRVLSVRSEAAKALVTFDVKTAEIVRNELYDLVADPGETSSLADLDPAPFGAEFVRAVARLYASVPRASTPAPHGASTR